MTTLRPSMTTDCHDIFRTHYRPLEPLPTGMGPVLRKLSGIRAVLFDVYGTLFVSGSGEVGTAREAACETALSEAFAACEIRPVDSPKRSVEYLFSAIEASHARSRIMDVDYPEVDIVEIWRDVLDSLAEVGAIRPQTWEEPLLRRLAVEYEARSNPVWPMPGLAECLTSLADHSMVMGIISNAQFYTPELFEALLNNPAQAWGFDASLQYYSYQYGLAKPGFSLFQMASEELDRREIEPREVLYVGNDMLNDIFPAMSVGFRTALFAGDARSLRLREDHSSVQGIKPDAVLTTLGQLSKLY